MSAAILAYDQDAPATLLVNLPEKKPATVRVSSSFTVESHSPFMVSRPEDTKQAEMVIQQSRQHILHALEKSGIQTPQGKINVQDVREFPPEKGKRSYITHRADSDKGPVAVLIGRDDATISKLQIDHAAEEAANYPSVNGLIVIGFAFGPEVRAEAKEQRGRITILKAQANQDLRVGALMDQVDDSAFILIGEPEIQIAPADNTDEITVEVVGYDTYNPGSKQLNSGGTRDIACWMIDTDYDGKNFFAGRVHFPGNGSDKQIRKYRNKLAARIDPDQWRSMLTMKSAPFKRPKSGRIAVRIVTCTGVEMTTVQEVGLVGR